MAKTKKQKEAERQARVDQIARLMAENERELQQKAQRMAEECDAVTGNSRVTINTVLPDLAPGAPWKDYAGRHIPIGQNDQQAATADAAE